MPHSLQVPSEIVQKWQEIVNLLAEIMHVPSSLIMKVEPPNIRVLVSSESKGNPYEPDEVACLNTGLYCETVMKTRQPLLVPDALADEDWKSNPDIKLGMISYLGFPISWPDGEIFGTICVLDNKKNQYSELYRKLLLQYRDVLQADLRSLATVHAELTTQRAHLEELFARVPEAIVLVDAGRVVRANPEFTKIFGYTESEVLGRSLNDLIVPEELRAEAREITRGGNKRGSLSFETVRTRKDGTRVPVSVMRVPVTLAAEGSRTAEYAIYRDMSERKRAEQALHESEEQWRAAFECNPTMYFIVDASGSIVSVNLFGAEQLGYDVSELIGQPVLNVFLEADRELVQRNAAACFERLGRTMRWEARKVRKDGTILWVRETANAVVLKNRPVLLVVCEDIADRKRAEALLAGEKRILEMVARGDSLAQILQSLCELVEEQAQGVLASVLLVQSGRLVHGGAPSLPKAYTDAIDGVAIGPSVASCGTAAYRGQQVIVSDIVTDPLWVDYRDAALRHSLRACWSTPIFSPEGTVIGTFAMYYREPRSPSARDQEIIEQITQLAGVAIQRKLGEEKLQRSEAYLSEAQRLSHTGSWAFKAGSVKAVYWSEENFLIWGFDPQRGPPDRETFFQRIHPEDRDRVRESFQKALRERRDYADEFRIVRPNGRVRHIHMLGHPVFSASGELVEVVGTHVDVTERRRGEEELRAAETRFRTYVDHATDALFVTDAQGKIVEVNRQACESLGYTREELIGMAPRDFNPRLVVDDAFIRWIKERLDAGEIFDFETSHRRKDGSLFPVEVRLRPFLHRGHRFALALVRDITERKRAEEEREAHLSALESMVRNLAESERKLEEAQRLTHVGYWDRDLDTGVIIWSDETYRIYGVPVEEHVPTIERIQELIHPEDRPMVFEAVSTALRGGERYDVEYRVIRPDGEVRIVHSQADVTWDESGRPHRMFGTVQDITERKRVEQRLLVQHTVTQILARAVTLQEATAKILQAVCECLVWDVGALWSLDKEAGVLRCVEVWHKESIEVPEFESASRDTTFMPGIGLPGRVWFRREPVYIPDVTRDANFLRAPIAGCEVLHAAFGFPILLGGEVLGVMEFFSYEIRQPDQDLLDMMATIGSQIGQFIERKRAEDALHRAQAELTHVTRVATLGEMTASIAHEVNQPLTAVIANANASLRWLAAATPNLDEARGAVSRIIRDGNRAGEVIARIRALVQKTDTEKVRLDINQTVQEIVLLMQNEAVQKGVAIRMDLAANVPPVSGDRIQLQQVILNLVMNGIEAMDTVTDRPKEILIRSCQHESDHLLVAVQDSGTGIDPQNLERIFDTFYTTKPQGMGMGLAISRSIVENHGGRLWAVPNDGPGATFQFTLLKYR